LIQNICLEKIFAFDLGSTWLDTNIDPDKISNLLIHDGYAVANIDKNLCMHGYEDFISRKTPTINSYYIKALYDKLKNEEEHNEIHDLINKKIMSINNEDIKIYKKYFDDISNLLKIYLESDMEFYMQDYIIESSRIVFKPILIKFCDVDDDKIDFTQVQIMLTLKKTGIGCFTLWFYPLNIKNTLKVEDLNKITDLSWNIDVLIIVPEKTSKEINKLNKIMVDDGYNALFIKMEKSEINLNNKELNKFNEKYTCWKTNLQEFMILYFEIIRNKCLISMNKKINDYNLTKLGYDYYSYDIIHLYGFKNVKIKEPFIDIISNYPKQICGLLINSDEYNENNDNYIRNMLLDVAYNKNESIIFSISNLLSIYRTKDWNNIKQNNIKKLLWVPDYSCMEKVILCEILCMIRASLNAYDEYLTGKLNEEYAVDELIKINKKILFGLEEINEARYMRNAYIDDWWWHAKKQLRIEKLNLSIKYKLENIYQIIINKRQDMLNRTGIMLTIFFGITSISSIWSILWEIGNIMKLTIYDIIILMVLISGLFIALLYFLLKNIK